MKVEHGLGARGWQQHGILAFAFRRGGLAWRRRLYRGCLFCCQAACCRPASHGFPLPWRGAHCHGWRRHRRGTSRPRYLGNDRHKRRTSRIVATTCVYLRCQLPAPGEYLLPADLPAPCYLRHHSSRNQRFSNNSRLLIRRPASPPIRTHQHPNTPINTLSAVSNVVHNSVSKPFLASKREITSRIYGEEGPSSIAYPYQRLGQRRRRLSPLANPPLQTGGGRCDIVSISIPVIEHG